MTAEEIIPLTNGLSVTSGPHTFVCDRARITAVADNAIDVSFWIAGTDYVPRLRLTKARLASYTADKVACLMRKVVRRAVFG